jgi:hypothetical protein
MALEKVPEIIKKPCLIKLTLDARPTLNLRDL